jgi:hypothetical protein
MMKLWISTCLWSLAFWTLCSICSNLNNLPGPNTISSSSNTVTLQQPPENYNDGLLLAFRIHYRGFEQAVQEAMLNPTDPTVLARLGDSVDEFMIRVSEVSTISFVFTLKCTNLDDLECRKF